MGQFAGIALMWFLIELLIWYTIGKTIDGGGWYVFFWFIVAFIIGISIMRKGAKTLSPMAQQMQAGGMMNPAMQSNESGILKSVAWAAAGVLLMIPGIMSDVFAIIVLLPPVQKKLTAMGKNYAMNNQEKMMEMMMKQMGGQGGSNPFGGMNGQNPFGGMNGQNPFGGMNGQNPFGGMNGQNPFGGFGNQGTTVDSTAKPVQKDVKKIKSANDD